MVRGITRTVLLSAAILGALSGCSSSDASGITPSPSGTANAAGAAIVTPAPPIGDKALLTLADLAQPGWQPAPLGTKPPPWTFEKPGCAAYRAIDYPAQQHRVEARGLLFKRPAASVREWVVRYETGWGTRSLADTRRVVEQCGSYEYGQPGQPGFRETNAIVDQGFAGDESMLVKTDRINVPGAIESGLTVLVRHADLVVTLTATGLPPEFMRRLGQRAIAHLA
jgi:hypothetical protein